MRNNRLTKEELAKIKEVCRYILRRVGYLRGQKVSQQVVKGCQDRYYANYSRGIVPPIPKPNVELKKLLAHEEDIPWYEALMRGEVYGHVEQV